MKFHLFLFIAIFLSINSYAQLIARVESGMNSWILINDKGQQIGKEEYSHMGTYSEGLIIARKGKWGYINMNGEEVIPTQYVSAGPFSCGIAAVSRVEDIFYYIDKTGRKVVPGPFSEARICADSMFFARIYGETNFRLYSYKGIEVNSKNSYKEANYFINGYASVKSKKGEWQIINTKGEVVYQDPLCSHITSSKDGMYAYRVNGKWGFIDSTFKNVIPAIYDNYSPFSEGYAKVELGGVRKLIDKSGKEIGWSTGFDDLGSYSDGMISVRVGESWGFLNHDGQMLVHTKFDAVRPFKEGIALVKVGTEWGYINKNGDWVIQPNLSGGKDCRNGFVIVEYPLGKCGFISSKGIVLPGKYNHARNFICISRDEELSNE